MNLNDSILLMVALDKNFDEYKLFIEMVDKYLHHILQGDTDVFIYYTCPNSFSRDLEDYFKCKDAVYSVFNLEGMIIDLVFQTIDCSFIITGGKDEYIDGIIDKVKELDIKHRVIDFAR